MFIKYNPEDNELVYCDNCGVILHKGTITEYTRDMYDSKISYMTCPVCNSKQEAYCT